MTDEERALTRRWLEHWQKVGPILEAERMAGLRARTDTDGARAALDLWRLARPGGGDDAAGLLSIKRQGRAWTRPASATGGRSSRN